MSIDTNRLQAILDDPNHPPKGRLELADESKFKNGQKPDETNFIQMFKSFINKVDDEIVVDAAKNIGIGKSPTAVLAAKLHIDGDLKVEGTATIDDNLDVEEKITAASLQFASGTEVNDISNDPTMGLGENKLSTQFAIKNYVDNKFAHDIAPVANEIVSQFFVGAIVPFANPDIKNNWVPGTSPSGNPPKGWLICDGSQCNAADDNGKLSNLFTAIGKQYGIGNGTPNSFNLPDLRGIFIRGMDNRSSENRDPEGGSRKHPDGATAAGNVIGGYQQDNYPSHTHRYYDYYFMVGRNGSIRQPSIKEIIFPVAIAPSGNEYIVYTDDAYAVSDTIDDTTQRFNETRPKNAIYMYCIKY